MKSYKFSEEQISKMEYLYTEEDMAGKQIGEILGCDAKTVLKHLRARGVEIKMVGGWEDPIKRWDKAGKPYVGGDWITTSEIRDILFPNSNNGRQRVYYLINKDTFPKPIMPEKNKEKIFSSHEVYNWLIRQI